jgi:hypothetical protein
MLDTLTSHNIRDFNARYNHTWGFLVQDNGLKKLVWVSKVTEERVSFNDSAGNKFFGLVDKGMMFEFIPITRGLFNVSYGPSNGVILLQRVAARQWQRGISANNTRAYILAGGAFIQHPLDTVIPKIFEGGQTNAKLSADMVDHILAKGEGVALSRHFAVMQDKMFFFNIEVGTVKDKKITLTHPTLSQEINDMLRRNKYNLQVING